MSTADLDLWQRHYVIEQASTAFFELELKYPTTAAMGRSGAINLRLESGYVFKEGDSVSDVLEGVFDREPLSSEAEVENDSWRAFLKSICGCAGQIFYASVDATESADKESSGERMLREHGERAIANVAAPYWKSLQLYGKHWIHDERLQELILTIIGQQAGLEKLTSSQAEDADA